jgi:hypothetical protein
MLNQHRSNSQNSSTGTDVGLPVALAIFVTYASAKTLAGCCTSKHVRFHCPADGCLLSGRFDSLLDLVCQS